MQNREVVPFFIRRKDLKTVVGLSPSSVDRLERSGQFPKRRKIGPGCTGWLRSEVEEYFAELQG